MEHGSILVVDDEKSQRDILKTILEDEGYDVEVSSNTSNALDLIKKMDFDIVLTDLKMPGSDGLDLLQKIINKNNLSCVIIMTAHGTIDTAVEAMKKGAFDYLTKPLERDELLLCLKRAFEKIRLVRENILLHQQLVDKFKIDNMIGSHGKMQEVFKIIKKVANSNSTVLICGESGTGKELAARAVHYNSLRKDKTFSAVSCAAIPDTLLESELFGHEKGAFTGAYDKKIGLIESTNGGTLFLDEIGELNPNMQSKLLRVLQEKEIRRVGGVENIKIDVRILAATNKTLEDEIKKKRFREDLYYRLNVISFVLPPLRERITDIPELIDHFIKKHNTNSGKNIKGIANEALQVLMNYNWPGNVRQLESVIERAMLMCEGDEITLEDLHSEIKRPVYKIGNINFDIPPEGISFEAFERELLTKAMEKSNWKIVDAAKLLGMSYRTLQYRLNKFNIDKEADVSK